MAKAAAGRERWLFGTIPAPWRGCGDLDVLFLGAQGLRSAERPEPGDGGVVY